MTTRDVTPDQPADRRHEDSDISGHGMLIFAVLFVAGLGLTSLTMLGLMWLLVSGIPIEQSTAIPGRILPAGPKLQSSIVHPGSSQQDLRDLEMAHARILGEYAWVDREHGIARIPVDRAMALYLAQGSPAAGIRTASRPASATGPAGGVP